MTLDFSIPGYTLKRELGRGGMATVYLAIQESFGRDVAIKVMDKHLLEQDESFAERFRREAKIVSQLVHPNIVTVYDVGEVAGQQFLSMEYVPGQELRDCAASLSLEEKLQVVVDVAKALDFAGAKGFVHRDVKPENILIHSDDHRAVLMDFGIARTCDNLSEMTQTGTAIGTPRYMSPEQARGQKVDHRADLYSLGIVFYWLLTQRVPFDGDSAVTIGIKHVSEPTPLLQKPLSVFQPILNRVLSKDPEHRYQRGSDLVKDFQSISQAHVRAVSQELKRKRSAVIERAKDDIAQSDPLAQTLVSQKTQSVDAAPLQATFVAQASSSRKKKPPAAKIAKAPEAEQDTTSFVQVILLSGLLVVLYLVQFRPDPVRPYLDRVHQHWLAQFDVFMPILSDAQQQLLHRLGMAGSDVSKIDTSDSQKPKLPETAPVQLDHSQSTQAQTEGAVLENAISEQTISKQTTSKQATVEQAISAGLKKDQLFQALDADISQVQNYLRDWRQQAQHQPKPVADYKSWLNEYFQTRIEQSLSEYDLAQSQAMFREYRAALPRSREAHKLIKPKIAWLDKLVKDLDAAHRLQQQGDWFSPAQPNAYERYRDLQTRAPDFQLVDGALLSLSVAVVDKAQSLKKQKLWQQALTELAQLPEALVSDSSAQLQAQLQTLLAKQQQLSARLNKAQVAQRKGRWQSALSEYRAVENEEFTKALTERAQSLSTQLYQSQLRQLEAYIVQDQLVIAQSKLSPLKQAFRDDPKLVELERQLLQAIDRKTPKVLALILAASQPELSASDRSLRLDRSLWVAFNFKDFQNQTSVIQAHLYDGSGRLQIAQVPVIVSGRDGDKQFSIERPVEGFTQGGYRLDLLLQGAVLTSTEFQVAN